MVSCFSLSSSKRNADTSSQSLVKFVKSTYKKDLQQKSTQNQKWEANGLPKHENDLAILRENILYFGNDTYPESPLIYIESALNILNIMVTSYHISLIQGLLL